VSASTRHAFARGARAIRPLGRQAPQLLPLRLRRRRVPVLVAWSERDGVVTRV